MTETPESRPRPTPRPRPTTTARPSPRPRVAGSRREREEVAAVAEGPTTTPVAEAPAVGIDRPATSAQRARNGTVTLAKGVATQRRATAAAGSPGAGASAERRRVSALLLVLTLLCALAATGAGVLLWQRLEPRYVDGSVIEAARDGVQALYAYDYEDSEGSIEGKLEVLTGELREQYEQDLSQGGIVDAYEQVSATTSYEVADVGLQQINEAQDTATLVVFGQYVVKSVNSGDEPAPQGSECQVTPEGAQSCVQTIQVRMITVDDEWKISELTLLTTS